jgi:hypothetical protein
LLLFVKESWGLCPRGQSDVLADVHTCIIYIISMECLISIAVTVSAERARGGKFAIVFH